MATRAESIMATVAAEMVDRGVDVSHSWGKKKDERHDRAYPRVTWTEADDDEKIEDAGQTTYDADDDVDAERTAIYERSVRLFIKVLAKTPEETEAVVDAILAAARHKLTISAFIPKRITKRGERPSSEHARTIDAVVVLPVFDESRPMGHIASTYMTAQVSNASGTDPQDIDQPPPP